MDLNFKIAQRRYLGNKNAILPFIEKIIKEEIGDFNSFCDIFAGTGTVGNRFNTKNTKIILNDLLYHNFVALNAFLSQDNFNKDKIVEIINNFNKLSIKEDNYFSINFGNRYCCKKNTKKIVEFRVLYKKTDNYQLKKSGRLKYAHSNFRDTLYIIYSYGSVKVEVINVA